MTTELARKIVEEVGFVEEPMHVVDILIRAIHEQYGLNVLTDEVVPFYGVLFWYSRRASFYFPYERDEDDLSFAGPSELLTCRGFGRTDDEAKNDLLVNALKWLKTEKL